MALSLWGPYAVMAPLAIWSARRFPLNRVSWPRNLFIHFLGAILFVIVCESTFAYLVGFLEKEAVRLVAEYRVRVGTNPDGTVGAFRFPPLPGQVGSPPERPMIHLMTFKAQCSFPLYWVLVGMAHAMAAMTALREREKQAAQLTAHLMQAQLLGLRTQLQPHFLFNTLNSIAALIPKNGPLATEMVMNLSDLLRMTLRDPQGGLIQLREELSLLNHYVEIQRLRFGERLAVRLEVDDEALECSVPPLLLQPLVENAIRHGLEASDQSEEISVSGRIEGGFLLIEVCNTFHGAIDDQRGPAESTGVGLANTRTRLQVQFGEKQQFEAGALPEGGFQVRMKLPAQPSPQLRSA